MTTTTEREITAQESLVAEQSQIIPVVEEFAHVSVARRETGGVRVTIATDDIEELHDVDLSSQRVEVTRHPVGREIDAVPEAREEGDFLIIPVVEERAVVVTKLFLTEEIHIRRTRLTEKVSVPVTLRRQHAVVEQLEPGSADLGLAHTGPNISDL